MEKSKVLVIGGGTAGMTSALEMSERGVEVILVEKDSEIGGRAATYCCKATDECNRCSACLVLQMREQVMQESNIKVFTDASVKEIAKNGDGFSAEVASGSDTHTIEAKAIVVATGFDPYDLGRRNEFSYGQEAKVITGQELDDALKEKGNMNAAFGDDLKKIGFVQCVGSRDISIGNGYCSRVCCTYAAKFAKIIRKDLPDAEIDIFYMDFQSFGKGFGVFKDTLLETDKIKLIRAIPSRVFGFPYDQLTVRYTDSYDGVQKEDAYDLLVLSVAITPREESKVLAEQLGLDLDPYGFMAGRDSDVETAQKGVFLAGVCQGPKDIPYSGGYAKAGAGAVLRYVES